MIEELVVDPVGNRTTTYSYDANDRLLQEQSAAGLTIHQYDANGNTVQTSGPNGTTVYQYNTQNQLVYAFGG